MAGDQTKGDVFAAGGVGAEEIGGLLGFGGPAWRTLADAGGGVLIEAGRGVKEGD